MKIRKNIYYNIYRMLDLLFTLNAAELIYLFNHFVKKRIISPSGRAAAGFTSRALDNSTQREYIHAKEQSL